MLHLSLTHSELGVNCCWHTGLLCCPGRSSVVDRGLFHIFSPSAVVCLFHFISFFLLLAPAPSVLEPKPSRMQHGFHRPYCGAYSPEMPSSPGGKTRCVTNRHFIDDQLLRLQTRAGLSKLVFWVQLTTEDYIRAENELQFISYLLCTQIWTVNHNFSMTQ